MEADWDAFDAFDAAERVRQHFSAWGTVNGLLVPWLLVWQSHHE